VELTHLAVTDLGVLISVLKATGKNPLNEGPLLTLNYISFPFFFAIFVVDVARLSSQRWGKKVQRKEGKRPTPFTRH